MIRWMSKLSILFMMNFLKCRFKSIFQFHNKLIYSFISLNNYHKSFSYSIQENTQVFVLIRLVVMEGLQSSKPANTHRTEILCMHFYWPTTIWNYIIRVYFAWNIGEKIFHIYNFQPSGHISLSITWSAHPCSHTDMLH